ncbi:MAG: cyclic nucleotide-binding domain-containing protein [Deltaproteobacteria bacterium]|nr:cyclic nucleotide-binding domain-containing protein [Kofleriaceae bacterium]
MSIRPDTSASWRRSTRDHAPVVLRRLLALVHSPYFTDVDLTELAVLAENAVESAFMKGEPVVPGRERLPSVHHVLEGRIEMADVTPVVWTPRMTVGLLEVFAGRALPAAAIAATDVRTLELDAADMFEILEDSFGLLSPLLRALAARALELPWSWPQPLPAAPPPAAVLGLVDRMILIRRHLPLYAVRMQPLTILAHAAREETWSAGEVIARAGARGRDVGIIVAGTVAASRDGEAERLLGPGAAFGALEVLAGRPSDYTLHARSDTRAVTLSPSAVFDVLEDHPELGLAIAGSLAGRLIDEVPRAATSAPAG